MFLRAALTAGVTLLLASASIAQQSGVYSRAAPPEKADLERLNLKTEWTLNIPIEGRHDSIGSVQTFGDQVFVQTRRGLIGAIDAFTGKLQWWTQLGNGSYGNVYPVAVNADFVYAVHVTKLYAFYRYTGVTEFVYELGTAAVAGPVADDRGIFVVLAIRPGAGGAHRVAAYDIPTPIGVQNTTVTENGVPKKITPFDRLTTRYPTPGVASVGGAGDTFTRSQASVHSQPTGAMTASRSPSLTVTNTVTAPFTLDTGARTPSLTTNPSLRQPYRLRGENTQNVQQSASISTIPPSVAAALALSDLRPKGISPANRWEFGTAHRVLFTPMLTPRRIWGASDGRMVVAMSKEKEDLETRRQIHIQIQLADQIAAAPAQSGTTGYFPITDGNLYAVDLEAGDQASGISLLWRSNLGGLMNHTPLVTDEAVYAAGDNSGVARVNRATGELIWRSDNPADRIIAANKDFAYIRDHQGRLLVYAAARATDPANRRSAALAGINLAQFNVNIVNTASDRIYLAADNGLIVCLRDASPKYNRPIKLAPDPIVNSPPKANLVPGMRMGGDPPESKIDQKADPKDEPKK